MHPALNKTGEYGESLSPIGGRLFEPFASAPGLLYLSTACLYNREGLSFLPITIAFYHSELYRAKEGEGQNSNLAILRICKSPLWRDFQAYFVSRVGVHCPCSSTQRTSPPFAKARKILILNSVETISFVLHVVYVVKQTVS